MSDVRKMLERLKEAEPPPIVVRARKRFLWDLRRLMFRSWFREMVYILGMGGIGIVVLVVLLWICNQC